MLGMYVVSIDAFREAMSLLGAAVSLITTSGPAGRYGFAASAVCSVTDSPPTLLVCVNQSSDANATIRGNEVVGVNVLAPRHQKLSRLFSTKGASIEERFADSEAWIAGITGTPLLRDATATFECRVTRECQVSTHSVFFCNVAAVRIGVSAEGLIYFNRNYHHVSAE